MIYIIVGPTASGKSELAHKLSDYLCVPIINADAFQIYKDMNIGTNKVDVRDPHYNNYHLLNIISPEETFSVKEYQELFRKEVDDCLKNYKDIVVVGGTGLYIRASIMDYDFPIMNVVSNNYDNFTNEELYEKLKAVDPKSLETIHINNRKRLIRALEIYDATKISKTEIINKQKHDYYYQKKEIKVYFINPDRESLYKNINSRVEDMFNRGLIDEVSFLLKKYNLSTTARAAIGYKETIDYLDGLLTVEECKELIKKRTRNYAKRQITYFKHQLKCKEITSFEDVIKDIKNG